MISFKLDKNIRSNVVNSLFSIIPASYIAGTLVLNLNIALFLIRQFYSMEKMFLDQFAFS